MEFLDLFSTRQGFYVHPLHVFSCGQVHVETQLHSLIEKLVKCQMTANILLVPPKRPIGKIIFGNHKLPPCRDERHSTYFIHEEQKFVQILSRTSQNWNDNFINKIPHLKKKLHQIQYLSTTRLTYSLILFCSSKNAADKITTFLANIEILQFHSQYNWNQYYQYYNNLFATPEPLFLPNYSNFAIKVRLMKDLVDFKNSVRGEKG